MKIQAATSCSRDRTHRQIRRGGAIGRLTDGIEIVTHGVATGFHAAAAPPGPGGEVHAHPVTDECLILFSGRARAYCQGEWHNLGPLDCILAPCGVHHGASVSDETTLWGGFAAPPQLDLYLRTEYFRDGAFTQPPFATLSSSVAG